MKISNKIWKALEAKYMSKDATTKKFLTSKLFSYKIEKTWEIMEQVNEVVHIYS